jgi:tRNA A37 threonylcarbamoyladenosine dehydratase
MQCLQEPNQRNVNNLNRVRHEASRHFRNKKKEYLKTKIDEIETNRKIENVSDFKNGYQPRTTIVKDEKSDWVTNCHSILATWRKHFSQLLNVYEVNEVR